MSDFDSKTFEQAVKETSLDSPDASANVNNLLRNYQKKIEEKENKESEEDRQKRLIEQRKREWSIACSNARLKEEYIEEAVEEFAYDKKRPVADNFCNFVILYNSKIVELRKAYGRYCDKDYPNADEYHQMRPLFGQFYKLHRHIINNEKYDDDSFVKKFRANPKIVPLPVSNPIPEVFNYAEDIGYLSSEKLIKKRLTSKEELEKQQQRDEEYGGKLYTVAVWLFSASLLSLSLIVMFFAE